MMLSEDIYMESDLDVDASAVEETNNLIANENIMYLGHEPLNLGAYLGENYYATMDFETGGEPQQLLAIEPASINRITPPLPLKKRGRKIRSGPVPIKIEPQNEKKKRGRPSLSTEEKLQRKMERKKSEGPKRKYQRRQKREPTASTSAEIVVKTEAPEQSKKTKFQTEEEYAEYIFKVLDPIDEGSEYESGGEGNIEPIAGPSQRMKDDILNIIGHYDSLGLLKDSDFMPPIPISKDGKKRRFIENPNLTPPDFFYEVFRNTRGLSTKFRESCLDSEFALIRNLQSYSASNSFGSYYKTFKDDFEFSSRFSWTSQFLNESELEGLKFFERSIFTWIITAETTELKDLEEVIFERLKSFYLENHEYLKKIIPNRALRIRKLLLVLEDIMESVKLKIQSLIQSSLELVQHVDCVIRNTNETIAKKYFLAEMLREHINDQINVVRHLDETCVWGLKPLRTSLIVPYFKTCTTSHSSPPIFKMEEVFITTKQKWTPRDCKLLIESITESYRNEKLQFAFFIFRKLIGKDADKYFQDNVKLDDDNILDAINTENGVERKRKRTSKGKKVINSYTQAELDKMRERAKKIFLEPSTNDSVSFENLVPLFSSKEHCENFYKRIQMDINKINFNSICREKINVFNWNDISRLLMEKTKKLRTGDDCRLGYEFSSDPRISNTIKRWSAPDKKKLDTLAEDLNLSWKDIAEKIGHGKTEFYSFYKYRSTMEFGGKMVWTDERDQILRSKITECNGNWNKTAINLGDKFATKKNTIERFKKTQNPILRFGKFTRTEDCLLMLTIEHLKAHFNREKHFGVLTSYLPWRYESAWRDRAENIFAEYIVPWTINEDRMLLNLAENMSGKRDWSKIAKQFESFKTRKGCLTRWKILEKGIKKFGTLEKYHYSYSLIRYNIQQYPHLEEISQLLTNVLKLTKLPFSGLERDRPPREEELQDLVLSFDKGVVERTIKSIGAYVEKRNAFWEEWRIKTGVAKGVKKKTHDRRTFNPNKTQSIASALHIRNILLKEKHLLEFSLSEEEEEIYNYYYQFLCTKAIKKDKYRPYIPPAHELALLPQVQRIIRQETVEQPISEEEAKGFVTIGNKRRGRPATTL